MHGCASPLHMHASVTSMFEKSHTPVSKRRSSQFSRPSSQIPSQRYAVLGQHGLSVMLFQTLAHARIFKGSHLLVARWVSADECFSATPASCKNVFLMLTKTQSNAAKSDPRGLLRGCSIKAQGNKCKLQV